MWEVRITHEGLHAYRVVRGVSKEEAELKARLQLQAWNARWKRTQDTEARRLKSLNQRQVFERQVDIDRRAKNHALELTREAESSILLARSLLSHSLKKSHQLDWESLKDIASFTKEHPAEPTLQSLPVEPLPADDEFKTQPVIPEIKFPDWIIPGARAKKLAAASLTELRRRTEANQKYEQAHVDWKRRSDKIIQLNESALTDHEKAKAAWLIEKHVFEERQKKYNQGVDELREQYLGRRPDSIVRYCTEVLARSEYPDSFPRDCLISFEIETGLLAIDFELPAQSAVPNKKTGQIQCKSRRISRQLHF